MSDALVFCSSCGQAVVSSASFCQHCGATLPAVPSGSPAASGTIIYGGQYAGFWVRFAAILIDGIVLGVLLIPLWFLTIGAAVLHMVHSGQLGRSEPDPAAFGAIFAMAPIFSLFSIVARWLYEAFFMSSSWQATLGKKALGLKVTDLRGGRLSFGHATGRSFAKIVTGLTIGIGYIMAGFTEKKQALHDMIASTLVVKS